MTLELDLPRRWWVGFAVLFGVFGAGFAVAAPLLLLSAVTSWKGGVAVAGLVSVLAAVWFLPPGIVAARIARSHPKLTVESDALVIDHPAILREPLRLARGDVHSVYVGRGALPPKRGTILSDRREGLVVSSWYAPDLSLRWAGDADLLIVLAEPIALRLLARRGLGLLNLPGGRGGTLYFGPTRWTIARGFFARVADEPRARTALESWPTAKAPPPRVEAWIRGPRRR